jgi:GNAT superfamily N-acetyltransferase
MDAMDHAIQALDDDQRQRFCALPGLTPLTPAQVNQHAPDASWMLANGSARCSLWWTAAPELPGQRLGVIGHYAAASADTAAAMLSIACQQLGEHGCTRAVGPMDGNTWRRYRLLTERGDEPLFFLEPDNPDEWPGHFTASGFTVLAQFYSAANEDLTRQDPRMGDVAKRQAAEGVRFRPLDMGHFNDELRRIYDLCLASFRGNFLYSPIGEAEFLELYQAVQPFLVPELVLLAEQGERLVGFVFTLPDLLQARRGQAIDTVILKTLAVHPDEASSGLGGLLAARCHETAYRLGYRRAIHALMHETNRSRQISAHTARTIRRYALFGRELTVRE